MSSQFTTADDAATLNATVTWRACLPPDHVARVIGDVITPRDLGALYARSGPRGGEAIALDMRCGLLCDGAATGPAVPARLNGRPTRRSLATAWRAASILLMTPWPTGAQPFCPNGKTSVCTSSWTPKQWGC